MSRLNEALCHYVTSNTGKLFYSTNHHSLNSNISPGWHCNSRQIASRVLNRIAFAFPVFKMDKLACVNSWPPPGTYQKCHNQIMPHLFRKNTNFQKKGIDIVREEPKKKSDQQELKYG
jgi:hypothetical protein